MSLRKTKKDVYKRQVQGLNVLTGYTGQISLGQAAFMLVGGYTSALTTAHFGLPFPLAVLAAGLATGLVGLLFGLPSLRVKGFYLAMATLAAQFIIPWLSRHAFPDLSLIHIFLPREY